MQKKTYKKLKKLYYKILTRNYRRNNLISNLYLTLTKSIWLKYYSMCLFVFKSKRILDINYHE